MIRLVDTQGHLHGVESFYHAKKRAEETGIFSIIAVGSDYESYMQTLEISGRYGSLVVYPALGLHPWNLERFQ
nr:hypothetical protein [Desulfobacterales bacterium]